MEGRFVLLGRQDSNLENDDDDDERYHFIGCVQIHVKDELNPLSSLLFGIADVQSTDEVNSFDRLHQEPNNG
jgi:hypothetical protein